MKGRNVLQFVLLKILIVEIEGRCCSMSALFILFRSEMFLRCAGLSLTAIGWPTEAAFETDILSAVLGLKSTLVSPSRDCPLLSTAEDELVLSVALNSCLGDTGSAWSSAGVESVSPPFDLLCGVSLGSSWHKCPMFLLIHR